MQDFAHFNDQLHCTVLRLSALECGAGFKYSYCLHDNPIGDGQAPLSSISPSRAPTVEFENTRLRGELSGQCFDLRPRPL